MMQGKSTWKMDGIEQLLTPRSKFAAGLAQRIVKGVAQFGSLLGSLGQIVTGADQNAYSKALCNGKHTVANFES